ncbi:UNVERIFIED_CONTAM: hypothetical protein H355_008235, partial [Colinus virginianus]
MRDLASEYEFVGSVCRNNGVQTASKYQGSAVTKGQVEEDPMSSIKGAAEFPVLLDPPSSPSAANGPVLAQVEGEGLWEPSGGFPRWPHAYCSLCSARAPPPRCVLACFYNKDNSTASCRFSSLSL